jgi:alkylation response protein AidB-like acyl-CoA dehydrogenase
MTSSLPEDLPLPGSGRTRQRWNAFIALAQHDLVAVRLAEGDADARAILAELQGPGPQAAQRWGVWAARPPAQRLSARRDDDGQWSLNGRMPFCSGATSVTDALVVADAPDGTRLFAVATSDPAVRPVPGTWHAVGMAASDSLDVFFDDAPATAVGEVGGYVERPGFWYGGMGVAACWYGGALGVARTLAETAQKRDVGPAALAHLGAIDVRLTAGRALLDEAATAIDAAPQDPYGTAPLRAQRLRAFMADTANEVIERVGRALGAGPLCHDAEHARRVADLSVYVRQHHAERDLELIGRAVSDTGPDW